MPVNSSVMAADGHLSDAALARELVVVGLAAADRVRQAAAEFGVRAKSNSTDVVTASDEAAELAIVDLLARQRPDDSVMGEEGTTLAGSSGRTWVIDPLDGTYNFTRGTARWCCAVALVRENSPHLGAVATGAVATGGVATGAVISGEVREPRVWVGGRDVPPVEDGALLAPLVDRPLAQSCVLTYLHPPHHSTPVGEAWRRMISSVATWRATGSGSLDATDVAAGRAELLVQHSVPLWDSAPGEALVLALGGASRRVVADGVEWFLLGAPTAVAEAAQLLAER